MSEMGKSNKTIARRSFAKAAGTTAAAGAAAASLTILKPALVRGQGANAKLKVGMIGCGGRGGFVANLFNQNGNYQVTALHDYFQDRVDGLGNRLKVDASQRFTSQEPTKAIPAIR